MYYLFWKLKSHQDILQDIVWAHFRRPHNCYLAALIHYAFNMLSAVMKTYMYNNIYYDLVDGKSFQWCA